MPKSVEPAGTVLVGMKVTVTPWSRRGAMRSIWLNNSNRHVAVGQLADTSAQLIIVIVTPMGKPAMRSCQGCIQNTYASVVSCDGSSGWSCGPICEGESPFRSREPNRHKPCMKGIDAGIAGGVFVAHLDSNLCTLPESLAGCKWACLPRDPWWE